MTWKFRKKLGPDYHRLKPWWKEVSSWICEKNSEARNGNYEKSVVVKNQGTKQRVQRSPGDCWQWETNGKCPIDIAESFSKIFYVVECEKMNRKPEVVEAETQVGKWLDCRARITSKEFAPIHYVKNGTLQSVCSTCQTMYTNVGEKCSCAHRQVDEQPSIKSKKNGDKNAVVVLKITRHLGCLSQDMDPPKSSSTTVVTADWRSVDAWRGHNLCQRIGYLFDSESPQGYVSSFIVRNAFRWTRMFIKVNQRSKPHLDKNGIRIQCDTENFVAIVTLDYANEFFFMTETLNPLNQQNSTF